MSSEDDALIRPAEAAQRLGIPASTLRRWSRRFAAFLSPQAHGLRPADGTRGHRRYTPEDLAVLARCKTLLSQGLTFDQVAAMLEINFEPEVTVVEGEVEEEGGSVRAEEPARGEEAGEMVLGEDAADLGRMMAQMISTLSGSQQMIITGQQTERELLSIVIQDNMNLKEENKRLRERMVETERRIFEMKREMERYREDERERMRQMEAYMFQLQRQLDDLVRSQRQPVFPAAAIPYQPPYPPAPAPASTPAPTPLQPAPAAAQTPMPAPEPSPSDSATPPAPASETATTPEPRKKRSFLDWLFGRE